MKTLLFLTTFIGIAASSAQSVTILTSDGNGADTFVRQGQASNNFGAATTFALKGGDASTTRKAYVRFDLSSITQPITEASLTLTVAGNNSGGTALTPGQTFNVDIYGLTNEALDNWVEGDGGSNNLPANEITYNNAPANVSPGNNFNEEATLLGTLNIPGTLVGETVTFSDPALVTFLNSDTNGLASILMRRQLGGSSNLAFRSKEASGTPQLDLTIGTPIPLEITGIVYDSVTDTVKLTWSNTAAGSYRIEFSTNLENWDDNDDTVGLTADQDEETGDPDQITITLPVSGLATDGKLFFRIEEEG